MPWQLHGGSPLSKFGILHCKKEEEHSAVQGKSVWGLLSLRGEYGSVNV